MEIKIYITNLGAYTRGELRGRWVDLPMDEDELDKVKAEILNTKYRDEELFITDFEAPFEISEYSNINDLNELAESFMKVIDSLHEDDSTIEAICKCVNDSGYSGDISKMVEVLENRDYCVLHGVYDHEDLALGVDTEMLPFDYSKIDGTEVTNYLDWDSIGRAMEMSYGWDIVGNGIAIQLNI